ncbi:MAG: stage II sporulation protein M, partial [Sphingomonas sp.]
FSASADYLRSTLYHDGDTGGLGTFATYLFTHNSQVCIFSFALGFMFGVPTAMLIVYNGAIVGAMFSLFGSHGLGFELGGWLIIHGSTEFFAIILAGAAGLRIGWAVVFPGEETRMAAATRAGRTSAIAMGGVLVMLLVAGLLEGFGRQLIVNDLARYAIGSTMLAGWLLYFYIPRRQDVRDDG